MTNGLGGNTLNPPESIGLEDLEKIWQNIPGKLPEGHFVVGRSITGLEDLKKWESFITKPENPEDPEAMTVTQTIGRFIEQNAVYDPSAGYSAMKVDKVFLTWRINDRPTREEHFEAAIIGGDTETSQAAIKLQRRRSRIDGYEENYSLLIPVNGRDFSPLPAQTGGGAMYYEYIQEGSYPARVIEQAFHGLSNKGDASLMGENLNRLILDLIAAKQLLEIETAYGELGTPDHLLNAANDLSSREIQTLDDYKATMSELFIVRSMSEAILARRFADPERDFKSEFAAIVRELEDSYDYDCDLIMNVKNGDADNDYRFSLPINWHNLSLRGFSLYPERNPVELQQSTVQAIRDLAIQISPPEAAASAA